MRQNFHEVIRHQREDDNGQSKRYNRFMIAGYFNEEYLKKQNLDAQKVVKDLVGQYSLNGYLFLKGCFYVHILQSSSVDLINRYLHGLYRSTVATSQLYKQIRVVYQSYENGTQIFKDWSCDHTQQPGPMLVETDKLEDQILERSNEIYDIFQDGAFKKKENPSHRIGNMILLSNDDMAILISEQFMTLKEYIDIYTSDLEVVKEAQLSYPLPPNMFDMIEFLEIEDYKQFGKA